MSLVSEPYEYVLFIDEAGDDGLRKVRPIDPDGSSEWLCIGAVLIRAENKQAAVEWVRDIRSQVRSSQGPSLHYNRLQLHRRTQAAELLAALPCRCFVVCSNKKNMRGHRNERAARAGGRQWFYNYCVRLLMERVTEYCYVRSTKELGRPGLMHVIFSTRGGHSYGQTKAYWTKLKRQSIGGSTVLNKRTIYPDVLRWDLVEYLPDNQVAGLQLADIVASAFYQAADALGPNWSTDPAVALAPRMGRSAQGVIADFGVLLQPTPPPVAQLTPEQQSIFQYYGYRFECVGPGP